MSLLAHPQERRTAAYMTAITLLSWLHWQFNSWSAPLLALQIAGAFGVSTMHHNHAHAQIFKYRSLNLAADFWFAFFQGHPGFAFQPLHVGSHHEFHNGVRDLTRTYRFRAGNDLIGLLRHPFEFGAVALGAMGAHLRQAWPRQRIAVLLAAAQYALLLGLDATLLALDWHRALYCVLIPQGAALCFLLASNYLQHAGADGESDWNHSRNFLGAINPLFFNVGYHTAHHWQPDAHWSELPVVHQQIAGRIAPALIEPGFFSYCWKRFVWPAPSRQTNNNPQENKHG